jgi:hypothetical protein
MRSMSDSPRAQKYREQAKRLREGAGTFGSRDLRSQVEEIARLYDLLAETVEKDATRRLGGG